MLDTIGKKIKHYRKEKGFTQEELSSKAKISRSYLGDIEGDRYNPSISTLKDVASALNVDISFLLTSDSTTNNASYYHDPEVAEMAQELKDNPDMRILLDASRDMTKEEMLALINFIKIRKGHEE